MFNKELSDYFDKYFILSVAMGIIAGLIVVYVCMVFDISLYGFNLFLIFAPLIAGFVETFFSQKLTNSSSGAISSVVLFVITNIIGWLFPAQAIKWNISTIGGLAIMLQAAFPITINYILIGLMLLFVYIIGRIGGLIGLLFNHKSEPLMIEDIDTVDELNILILNNEPEMPIKKYHGLIFAEEVFEFEEKDHMERIEYLGSTFDEKNAIKLNDYLIARNYILRKLEKEAYELGANAIIDIEIEYTNYNQQLPPDMLMSAYGTAVCVDEKYLNKKSC